MGGKKGQDQLIPILVFYLSTHLGLFWEYKISMGTKIWGKKLFLNLRHCPFLGLADSNRPTFLPIQYVAPLLIHWHCQMLP